MMWMVFSTRCEARAGSVLDRHVLCAVCFFFMPWIIPYLIYRLSDEQQVGDDGYRYLLRATMGRFRGISIGIESNSKGQGQRPQ